ncbi:MAG: hypothetical protein AB8I08_02165 [Sandaracinaceae bacterium]
MTKRFAMVLAVLACACSPQTGTLAVSASGEGAAVDGYPFEDVGFVDGWTMQFDVVLASVESFSLRGADGLEAGGVEPVLIDLHLGDAPLYDLAAVDARRWEDVRYVVAPATAASVDVGPVDPALRAQMIEEGWSLYVAGTAQKGETTRTFAWGFALDVLNSNCVSGDGTAGVVVPSNGTANGLVTLHLDHLFFDSLALDEAEMRFDAIAAMAEPDGSIPLANLANQRLASMQTADGSPLVDDTGAPIVYDPGSAALPEPTLLAMMQAAAVTIGHWQGEGHCDYTEQ